jgi:regulator of sigma E protease
MVNLLPLPTLDGGHILYTCLEKVRGKPLALEIEVLIYRFMLAALFIFCMQLVANDLDRYAASLKKEAIQKNISAP